MPVTGNSLSETSKKLNSKGYQCTGDTGTHAVFTHPDKPGSIKVHKASGKAGPTRFTKGDAAKARDIKESGQDDAVLGWTAGRRGGHAGYGLQPNYGV